MTYADKEKVERLRATFDLNYKLTKFYSIYLEHYPELINSEMIDELCSDGRISKTEALIALICEAFGLDDERGGTERRLIRDYIRPSVKLLDAKKYTENKYYRNIKIRNTKDGEWEFRNESYEPYRAVICDDMVISSDFSEYAPLGFFEEKFYFPAVLENGNEWMTLTPVDLDTCEMAIDEASGKVITFGLGLGYYAYMVSEKKEVESVTVIEKSQKVINLFKKHILPQFTHSEKVNIICSDAFEYAEFEMPKSNYDYAFVDTWRDASDGAPMYERMKKLEKLSPNTKFSYWIENFLISRLRAFRFEKLYKLVADNADDAPKNYKEFTEMLVDDGCNI
ncbi:MAG: hypothetical protein E7612_10855 [Ruminococcaceae bacterium]|nr:hypothetical protein [Oscillospiraceae bacterium]